jgi:hypothetical protein
VHEQVLQQLALLLRLLLLLLLLASRLGTWSPQ